MLRLFLVACAASAGNLRASSSAGFSQIFRYFVGASVTTVARAGGAAVGASAGWRCRANVDSYDACGGATSPQYHTRTGTGPLSLTPQTTQGGKATGAVWFVFLHPTTAVSVRRLRAALAQRQHDRNWFLGHALHDTHGSIAHEYNTELAYPLDRAGYALSASLLGSLASWLKAQGDEGAGRDFHIDATWAFARFVHDRTKHVPSGAVVITDEPAFCGAGSGRGDSARAVHVPVPRQSRLTPLAVLHRRGANWSSWNDNTAIRRRYCGQDHEAFPRVAAVGAEEDLGAGRAARHGDCVHVRDGGPFSANH